MLAFLIGYKIILLGIFLLMSFAFLLSIYYKRNDIVDFFWAMNFVVTIIILLRLYRSNYPFILLSIFVIIWAVRLSGYLLFRIRSTNQDKRYVKMSSNWNGRVYFWLRSYLQIFILQGLLAAIICFPIIVFAQSNPTEISIKMILGGLIMLVAIVVESVADWQLIQFKLDKDNKGKILQQGLWKYSRHPNYFGEILMWWGVYVFSITGWISILSLISPILITFLIIRVSGVSMQESFYQKNKSYQRYALSTNALLPISKTFLDGLKQNTKTK